MLVARERDTLAVKCLRVGWRAMESTYFTSIIFMKVGPHSGYNLNEIFAIKKREEKLCGKFFWGYAGTLCHPSKVNAFVRQSLNDYGGVPMLVMTTTPSKYFSRLGMINEYSTDGNSYHPLPRGVLLTGCTFSVIGKKLEQVDFTIDLNKYDIVNTKNAGRPLGEYIRYHVNKGCAVLSPSHVEFIEPRNVRVSCIAQLVPPYCVFLR